MNVKSIDMAIVFVLRAQLELTICAKYNRVAQKKITPDGAKRTKSIC